MLKILKWFPFKSNFTIYYLFYSLASKNYLVAGKMPNNNLTTMIERLSAHTRLALFNSSQLETSNVKLFFFLVAISDQISQATISIWSWKHMWFR